MLRYVVTFLLALWIALMLGMWWIAIPSFILACIIDSFF